MPELKDLGEPEVVVGEISAWRAWRLSGDSLTSVYQDQHMWWPGEPMTGDSTKRDEGVYSFKKKSELLHYLRSFNPVGRLVVGKVNIWGNVVEHKLGYRSEYAEITEIHLVTSYKETLPEVKSKLCKIYDVENVDSFTKIELAALKSSRLVNFLTLCLCGAVMATGVVATVTLVSFLIYNILRDILSW